MLGSGHSGEMVRTALIFVALMHCLHTPVEPPRASQPRYICMHLLILILVIGPMNVID